MIPASSDRPTRGTFGAGSADTYRDEHEDEEPTVEELQEQIYDLQNQLRSAQAARDFWMHKYRELKS